MTIQHAQKNPHDLVRERAMAMPSVARANRWWLLYRQHLYRCSRFENRMWTKLIEAQRLAWLDVDAVMTECGVNRLVVGSELIGLTHAPRWGGSDWYYRVNNGSAQANRRQEYWNHRNQEWAKYWEIRYAAIVYLRHKLPLSSGAIAQTERWMDAQTDMHARRAIESNRYAEIAEEEKKKEAKLLAKKLLADMIPGATAQRRMRKAEGYEILVNLLESANVDDETKEAIGRLRNLVEQKQKRTARLPATDLSPASSSGRRRCSQDRRSGFSAVA